MADPLAPVLVGGDKGARRHDVHARAVAQVVQPVPAGLGAPIPERQEPRRILGAEVKVQAPARAPGGKRARQRLGDLGDQRCHGHRVASLPAPLDLHHREAPECDAHSCIGLLGPPCAHLFLVMGGAIGPGLPVRSRAFTGERQDARGSLGLRVHGEHPEPLADVVQRGRE